MARLDLENKVDTVSIATGQYMVNGKRNFLNLMKYFDQKSGKIKIIRKYFYQKSQGIKVQHVRLVV